MYLHGTINVVMFAVAGNDTRKYTISTSTKETQHTYDEGNAKQLALSFSLFLSLFLYSSSSLVEEENDDGDDFL